MKHLLENCNLCERHCGVNRLKGEKGFCGAGYDIEIARYGLHLWEEPCISGERGSGTVFFTHCSLGCVFCQNHEISAGGKGYKVTIEELSDIFLLLQTKGAHNINLVTPTHYVPQIVEALTLSRSKGLSLPVLYNCSSYESLEALEYLRGHIQVYLPDLKYYKDKYSQRYSKAPNYFKTAAQAIKEMHNQVGKPLFDEDNMIASGVIIRHLMLPSLLFDSLKLITFVHEEFGDQVYFSLMNQYTPMYRAEEYPDINRPLSPKHYEAAIDYCLELNMNQCFIQEEGTSSEAFVPEFYDKKSEA